jgi:serine/threonine protein kinase
MGEEQPRRDPIPPRREPADRSTQTSVDPPTETSANRHDDVDPEDYVSALSEVDGRHYTLGRELGRGGMGRILQAEDLRLGRSVAIKELLKDDGKHRRRFEREALITARLQHPSIVNVYEAGRWSTGQPFYVMNRVAGRSLQEIVAESTSLTERLSLLPNVVSVVEALAW